MSYTNIPSNPNKAIDAVVDIDNRQLSPGSGGINTHRYEDWHWTPAESAMFTSYRVILVQYREAYANKNTITTAERSIVKQTLKAVREYSGHGVTGHRLFLKIAAFGDTQDWNIANIKLGTPLAKKPALAQGDSPVALQPVVIIKEVLSNEMILTVENPQTPSKVALPKGMKFSKVYRYVGSVAPKSTADFEFYGNAKKGRLAVNFDGIDLSGTTKLFAWFFARYESNKGELGQAGGWVSKQILS